MYTRVTSHEPHGVLITYSLTMFNTLLRLTTKQTPKPHIHGPLCVCVWGLPLTAGSPTPLMSYFTRAIWWYRVANIGNSNFSCDNSNVDWFAYFRECILYSQTNSYTDNGSFSYCVCVCSPSLTVVVCCRTHMNLMSRLILWTPRCVTSWRTNMFTNRWGQRVCLSKTSKPGSRIVKKIRLKSMLSNTDIQTRLKNDWQHNRQPIWCHV